MKKLAILAAAAFPLLLLILVDLIRSEDDFTASSPQLFDHSSRLNQVMLQLIENLSGTIKTTLEDQEEAIETIQDRVGNLSLKLEDLQEEIVQNGAIAQGGSTKLGTLANRVFQLEEQRGADEAIWVFNTVVCNASIQILRKDFEDFKSALNESTLLRRKDFLETTSPSTPTLPPPRSVMTTTTTTEAPSPPSVIHTVIEETNELLKSANERYSRLEQLVTDTFRGLKATDRELKAERIAELNGTKNELRDAFFRLDNMDLKMAALEIRLNDQNRERDAISPTTSTSTTTTTTTPMTTTTSRAFPTGGSRQFPATKIIYQTDEAVLTRQAALESRMNALESLFFASKAVKDRKAKNEQKRKKSSAREFEQRLRNVEIKISEILERLDSVESFGRGGRGRWHMGSLPTQPTPAPPYSSYPRCRGRDEAKAMSGLDEWCRKKCRWPRSSRSFQLNCPSNLCICD